MFLAVKHVYNLLSLTSMAVIQHKLSFSFYTGCHTKAKELSLPCNLPREEMGSCLSQGYYPEVKH